MFGPIAFHILLLVGGNHLGSAPSRRPRAATGADPLVAIHLGVRIFPILDRPSTEGT